MPLSRYQDQLSLSASALQDCIVNAELWFSVECQSGIEGIVSQRVLTAKKQPFIVSSCSREKAISRVELPVSFTQRDRVLNKENN